MVFYRLNGCAVFGAGGILLSLCTVIVRLSFLKYSDISYTFIIAQRFGRVNSGNCRKQPPRRVYTLRGLLCDIAVFT